jgi:hypothetical protein
MDVKKIALEHFEKALLGLAGLWLLSSLLGFAQSPAGMDAGKTLSESLERVQSYAQSRKETVPVVPAWEQDVQKQLAPEHVGTAVSYPTWVLHNRPNVLFKFKGKPPRTNPIHEAPRDLSARPDLGLITVTFDETPENKLVRVVEYRLERREGTDGDFAVIATLEGDAQTLRFEDRAVGSRRQYYYRVVSAAEIDMDNPVNRKRSNEGLPPTLKPEAELRTTEDFGPVTIPPTVIVVPNKITEPTDQELVKDIDAPAKVDLTVHIWAGEEGAESWIKQRYYQVKVGAKIGSKKKKGDFRAGILKEAEITKRPHPKIEGYEIECFNILVDYGDGAEEVTNSLDRPKALEGVK